VLQIDAGLRSESNRASVAAMVCVFRFNRSIARALLGGLETPLDVVG
jgi:hypothetical protein